MQRTEAGVLTIQPDARPIIFPEWVRVSGPEGALVSDPEAPALEDIAGLVGSTVVETVAGYRDRLSFAVAGATPDWYKSASCAGADSQVFFPSSKSPQAVRAAKRICAGCVVKADCLRSALAMNEEFGVWGGRSEAELRKLKKRRKGIV